MVCYGLSPITLQEEMDLIGKELHHHFSPAQLEALARQTGFVQSKSKMTAQISSRYVPF